MSESLPRAVRDGCMLRRAMNWLVRFAMRAMLPRAAGLPGVEDTGLREFVPRLRRECAWLFWAGVVLGSVVFQLTPLFTILVPLPACLLTRRALDRHAAKLASHPLYFLRSPMMLIKVAAGYCWGAHADVRKLIGVSPYPADPDEWRTR